MNLDQLTDAVMQKIAQHKPRALLIGTLSEVNDKFNYVNEKPYDAIVIGQLQPGQMLRMPTNTVCHGLLDGKPVYICKKQPWHSNKNARPLCRELSSAQQRLYRLGVVPLEEDGKLLTAKDARILLQLGQKPAGECRLTPLARDILEGRQT